MIAREYDGLLEEMALACERVQGSMLRQDCAPMSVYVCVSVSVSVCVCVCVS